MFLYVLKRLLHALPILLGANVITFCLFFMVNSPDDIARMHLGNKYTSQEMIQQWKQSHGYNYPMFFDSNKTGVEQLSNTLLFKKTLDMFSFNFGRSNDNRDIATEIKTRMWPSLAIAIPTLFFGLTTNILLALFLMVFRYGLIEAIGLTTCIVLMSISGLFYIIGGQYLLAVSAKLGPISGYLPGTHSIRFVVIPVIVGVLSGIGVGGRWYHSLMQEEANKEYVKAAAARGASIWKVLSTHILPNAMVPIVTSVVAILPLLFMGSLLIESFFAIPGLGSYTIDAIASQDFEIVRVMVFLGALFYVIGLVLTDVTYTLVDPRIRFKN